jgi:hypothetical protein
MSLGTSSVYFPVTMLWKSGWLGTRGGCGRKLKQPACGHLQPQQCRHYSWVRQIKMTQSATRIMDHALTFFAPGVSITSLDKVAILGQWRNIMASPHVAGVRCLTPQEDPVSPSSRMLSDATPGS